MAGLEGAVADLEKGAPSPRKASTHTFEEVTGKGKAAATVTKTVVVQGLRLVLLESPEKMYKQIGCHNLVGLTAVALGEKPKSSVTLTFSSGTVGPLAMTAEARIALLSAIDAELGRFPGCSLSCLCGSLPEGVSLPAVAAKPDLGGDCGGYIKAYIAIANNLGLTPRVAQMSQLVNGMQRTGCTALHANALHQLDLPDAAATVGALHWNQYFTSFTTANAKPTPAALESILMLAGRTSALTSLTLSNIGVKPDFWGQLASAFQRNPNCGILSLDLSKNAVEDRGAIALVPAFASLRLESIDLRDCGIGPKGGEALAKGLAAVLPTLTSVVLRGNPVGPGGVKAVLALLESANNVHVLDLGSTGCFGYEVISTLARCHCGSLRSLRLDDNKFLGKKAKPLKGDLALSRFTSTAVELSELDLAQSSFPPDALQLLMNGLTQTYIPAFFLRLAGCELDAAAATLLSGCICMMPSLTNLDLSDNEFGEADLGILLDTIATAGTVKRLVLDRTLLKSKSKEGLVAGCARILRAPNSVLESLSVADCGLRDAVVPLLHAAGASTTLSEIDVSGNAAGDAGASALAASLYVTSTVKKVTWDNNGTSAVGLAEVTAAVQAVTSPVQISLPVHDVAAGFKVGYDEMVKAVQDFLAAQASVRAAGAPSGADDAVAAAPAPAAVGGAKPPPPASTSKPDLAGRKPPPRKKPPSLETAGDAPATSPGAPTDDDDDLLGAIAGEARLLASPHKTRAKPKPGTRRLPSRKPGASRGEAVAAAYRKPTLILEDVGETKTDEMSPDPPSSVSPAPTPEPVARKPPPTAKPRAKSSPPEGVLTEWFVKKGRKAFDADRKRYFVLTPLELKYYVDGGKDGLGHDLKGSINIWKETVAAADDNRLMITNPDRNWVLTATPATKPGACRAWLEAVEAAVADAPSKPEPPKVAPRVTPKKEKPTPAPKGNRPWSAAPTPTTDYDSPTPSPSPQSRPISAPVEEYVGAGDSAPVATSPAQSKAAAGTPPPPAQGKKPVSAPSPPPQENKPEAASADPAVPDALKAVDAIVSAHASAANSDDEGGDADGGGGASEEADAEAESDTPVALTAVDMLIADMAGEGISDDDDDDGEATPAVKGEKDEEMSGFGESDEEF